jgi:hypothetical protein
LPWQAKPKSMVRKRKRERERERVDIEIERAMNFLVCKNNLCVCLTRSENAHVLPCLLQFWKLIKGLNMINTVQIKIDGRKLMTTDLRLEVEKTTRP